VLGGLSQLARVLASRGQPGAGLALSTPLVSVDVIRGQLVTPLAAGLAGVLGGNRPSAPVVLPVNGRLPVRGVLAAAVLARSAAAAVTAVMARVIHGLARLKRADKLLETVTMSTAFLVKHPIPAPVYATSPRPAVTRAPLIDVGEVPLQLGGTLAEQPAPDSRSLQLAVVGRAKPQGERWLTAGIRVTDAPLGAMTGLQRIPVFAQLCVVGTAQPPGEHGPITMGTFRHSFSI
jgi:hypothetical protein